MKKKLFVPDKLNLIKMIAIEEIYWDIYYRYPNQYNFTWIDVIKLLLKVGSF